MNFKSKLECIYGFIEFLPVGPNGPCGPGLRGPSGPNIQLFENKFIFN